MGFRGDMGHQGENGGGEESQPDAVKDPHDQKGPERRRNEIGKAGKNSEEGPRDHELSLGKVHEGPSYDGTENQRGDAEDSDKKPDLCCPGLKSGQVDRDGWNEDAEDHRENELSKKTKDKVTAEYLLLGHILEVDGWDYRCPKPIDLDHLKSSPGITIVNQGQ